MEQGEWSGRFFSTSVALNVLSFFLQLARAGPSRGDGPRGSRERTPGDAGMAKCPESKESAEAVVQGDALVTGGQDPKGARAAGLQHEDN